MIFCPDSRRYRRVRRAPFLGCALALGAALLAQPAAAQEGGPLDPFRLRLTGAMAWDSNVFRLPASAPDPQLALGRTGKADRSDVLTYGLRFDKSYSQQHFVVDLSRTQTRYDKFISLNRNTLSDLAQWDWRLGARLSGRLSADRTESVVDFEDIVGSRTRIVTRRTNRAFSIDGWLGDGWHLQAGLSNLESKNSTAFAASPSFTQTSGELGLNYIALSGNSITATARSRRGANTGQAVDFVNFLDSGFAVQEHELAVSWVASGNSTLNGRLTRIERRNDHIAQRDFSGAAGELRYLWTPTGRLTLGLSAVRTLIPFTPDTRTSYKVDDTLSFTPAWAVAANTTLRMNLFRRTTDYLGPVVPVTGPLRRDVLTSAQVAVDWKPHDKVTLSASLQRDRRTSNDAAFTYDDTIARFNAALLY